MLVPLEIVAREDNPRLPQTEKKDEKLGRKTANGGGDTRLEKGKRER